MVDLLWTARRKVVSMNEAGWGLQEASHSTMSLPSCHGRHMTCWRIVTNDLGECSVLVRVSWIGCQSVEQDSSANLYQRTWSCCLASRRHCGQVENQPLPLVEDVLSGP